MAGIATRAQLAVGVCVADEPDGVRTIIRYQQRSVLSLRDTNGPSPDVSVVDHKSCHKVFVLTVGPACVVQGYANHFISGAHRSIPRTVLGCENVSLIFGRKLL
jgi:hypothetical protein